MVKLKDTTCYICGKPIKAEGKNLAICMDCDSQVSEDEKLRPAKFEADWEEYQREGKRVL